MTAGLRRFLAGGVLTALGLTGAATTAPRPLLGQPLFRSVPSVEGPVPAAVGVEDAAFCRTYQCVGSASVGTTTTGTQGWYVVPPSARAAEVLRGHEAGRFFPEATVMYERNVVMYTDLAFDTAVRQTLSSATLNLLGHFTRLVLGAPISGQKLAACYRILRTQARCTVGSGRVRLVSGETRTYQANFRVLEDPEGRTRVKYAVGLDE
ncbi:hypothetical protein [Deinococcus arcticus]|uniref:Uncharacterized protein n=1 Tax=Deinococcus arcticus TaxID=2136176 RepID=A0A2T3W5W0_9DEIO|nr:hypothetical protein [Deinococcus arcticus]PTA67174.1 hypothetical protein C8263_13835 [Deinococcus arcticus]